MNFFSFRKPVFKSHPWLSTQVISRGLWSRGGSGLYFSGFGFGGFGFCEDRVFRVQARNHYTKPGYFLRVFSRFSGFEKIASLLYDRPVFHCFLVIEGLINIVKAHKLIYTFSSQRCWLLVKMFHAFEKKTFRLEHLWLPYKSILPWIIVDR